MVDLKKAVIAVLAFGSSSLFAGTMGPVCTPDSVTVPCERTAWDFGIEALYLNSPYADYFANINTLALINEGRSLNAWGWGFKLDGSYHFSTGNDVNVNWYHRDTTINNNYGANVTIARSLTPGLPFNASFKYEWDAVNFEFGQTVNFGQHEVIRFHGGAQYANIETKAAYTALGIGLARSKEEMSGFGPRAGLDMAYHLGNGLALYANAASALIVGKTKFDYAVLGIVGPSSSRNNISPELELKLGANYNYAMAQGDLILDAGWMTINYFNVLQLPGQSSLNFNLNGPYFGGKWIGNLA